MHNCADDVIAYHDSKVTLPQSERSEMAKRRDANRKRVKTGLERNKKPQPIEFYKQGSYAMKTMVQDSDNLYDIDDGIYFAKEDLKGDRGAEMSALQVRQMVRDAVDDGSFNRAPEVLPNCVRVYYDAGYHVDLPSYRRVATKTLVGDNVTFELASTEWKRSDARDVTKWFDSENSTKSPDEENGRQFRRICRYLKKFAQSRPSWRDCIASGFMITKLASERYSPDAAREDESLYKTMLAIRDRLEMNLVVTHPVTPNDTITKGDQDPKAKFFKEKLSDAIRWLAPTQAADCTREDALACWDKVFNTAFFSNRGGEDQGGGGGKQAVNSSIFATVESGSSAPVRKDGGGSYA
jgi:hypothetical protein